MTYTFFQLLSFQRVLPPNGLLGWMVWLALLVGAVLIARRFNTASVRWSNNTWAQFFGLALAVPLSILIVTFRLPVDGALPIPGIGSPAIGSLLAPLAAVPWAAGLLLLGLTPALVLAALTGLFLAFWDTRSIFTIVELSLVSAIFSVLLKQQYRTNLFTWLRQPILAGFATAMVYPPMYILTSFFWVSPSPITSLDFSVSRVLGASIAMGAPMLLAGLAIQLAGKRWPTLMPASGPSQPAPSERSLEARFFFTLGPIVLFAILAMGALTWWTAGRSAEQLFSDRMANSLEIAAASVPFVLENGQNLILQLSSNSRLADPQSNEANSILASHLNEVPYFDQLSLLDTGGNSLAGFPTADYSSLNISERELDAVALAIQGVSLQILSVPPAQTENTSAQLLFIAAVRNANNQVRGVLIGRTALGSNPLAEPIVQSLESINMPGAQGLLIDSEGRIVMAPVASALLQPYNSPRGDTTLAYETTSADGSRLLVQYQPVAGSNWGVVAAWPARLSQQLALTIALPILAVLFLLAIVGYFLFRLSLRSVTGSLRELAVETQRIASGELNAPLSVKGADEIGRLGSAFETMRQSLRSRGQETQRLLTLSHDLSSGLEVRTHIDPILDAALAGGAEIARLVFLGQGNGTTIGFGKGSGNEKYESIDSQILSLTRAQPRILLSNPARARLKFEKGTPAPKSLAAFALNDRKEQLGAIWLAYDQVQNFPEDVVGYLEALASQAANAVTNARQYVNVRLGQQRLESFIMDEPLPILVTDAKQNLVFVNSEAARLFGIKQLSSPLALSMVVNSHDLLSLFSTAGTKSSTAEVELSGRTYSATVSPLWSGADLLGFVAKIQDVTKDKQTAATRADFLGTIGHDLHDPLELVRGYLSMLGMVGELNPQQAEYVDKIGRSVDSISQLASSLLAAERLQGDGGLQLERFPIKEVIDAAVNELSPRLRQKKMLVEVEALPGSAPQIEADRTLLQRAVYNLLDNAMKFSPRSAKVEVGLKFDARSVTVSIKDSGPGVAPVDLPGLFEKGQMAGGLSIVKSIAQRHGGKAWVQSELGVGSTFYLQVPLTQVKK